MQNIKDMLKELKTDFSEILPLGQSRVASS